MFERFTKDARTIVVGAQAAAQDRGEETTTAHVLLALTRDPGSIAGKALDAVGVGEEQVRGVLDSSRPGRRLGAEDAEALRSIGIDLEAIRRRVEEAFGPGALDAGGVRSGRPRFSREAKKSLELALREAIRMKHKYIGTEHLLLGLMRAEGDGWQLLRDLGADLPALRSRLESGGKAA